MTTTEKYYKIKSGIEIPSQDTLQVTDSNRPTIRPTLNLNFAQAKVLDPRITFARASTATYYDGKTVTKAEENLLLWSQDFSNAIWTKLLTLGSTTETAPDGTATAAVISNSSNFQTIRRDISVAGDVVFSIAYKKTSGATYFPGLSLQSATSYRSVALNTDTGVATPRDIEPVPAGEFGVVDNGTFWRVWIRHTAIQVIYIYSRVNTNAGAVWTGGNGSQTIWGAQLEGRSTPTAYTPTTTQPITNYIPVLQTAPANVARFEHNPMTGESLGLEIEEQRTNSFTYSGDFSNPVWTKDNSTITANTIVSPDGTLTGDKIIASTATAKHRIAQNTSASGTNTMTVYAKAGEWNCLYLESNFSNPNEFNLSTGVVTKSGESTSASMTNVGNGWWRCTVVGIGTSATTIGVGNNGVYSTITGDGYSGIYVWGAQLEAGAFATSYIPTVESQVTRAADNASMTGSNFSSWYNPSQSTVYCESSTMGPNSAVVAYTPFNLNNGSQTNAIFTQYYNTLVNAIVRTNNQEVARMNSLPVVPNTFYKTVISCAQNDFATSTSGASVVTDTVGIMPLGVNVLDIGKNYSNQQYLNGTIKKITYYPARITNAQLQSITS